jgi:predicted nucleic acid-binding protein
MIVDASVLAEWALAEPRADTARALYDDCTERAERIIAPPLLPFELANIVRQRMVRTGLSLPAARGLLGELLAFPVSLVQIPGLYDRALSLPEAHGPPAAYDAHYLAPAERYACTLWTDDQRLLRLVGGTLPFVSPIGDYQRA